MATNTRLGQANAAMKEALGLNRAASVDEVNARIKELTEGHADEAQPDRDPAFDEEVSRYIDREWKLAEKVYGAQTVQTARAVQDLALTGASPSEFLEELSKLVGQGSGQQQAAPQQQAPQQGQQPQAPQQQRDGDAAPEGDGPVDWTVQPEQDEIGSGDSEGAARKLFASIFPVGGRR